MNSTATNSHSKKARHGALARDARDALPRLDILAYTEEERVIPKVCSPPPPFEPPPRPDSSSPAFLGGFSCMSTMSPTMATWFRNTHKSKTTNYIK